MATLAGTLDHGTLDGGTLDAIPADYCTLAEVKLWLASSLPDGAQDDTLAARIGPASRLIDRVAGMWDGGFGPLDATRDLDVTGELTPRPGREWGRWDSPFGHDPVVETRYWWHQALAIRLPPLLAAAQVLADDDGDGVYERELLERTDFVLDTTWGPPYRQLTWLRRGGTQPLPGGQRRLRVAGTWGLAWAVPAEITQLAVELVARKWKRADAPFGIAGSPETGVLRVPSDEDYARQALQTMGRLRSAGWVLA